jgi:hypothetical protein
MQQIVPKALIYNKPSAEKIGKRKKKEHNNKPEGS